MGMVFEAHAITADRASEVTADPDLVEQLVEAHGPPETRLDLDKAWHGLHWLLTGSVDEVDSPLGLAVLGGEPVGDDWGYGPPRLLAPDDVRRAADALAQVTVEDLRSRFDRSAMLAAGVYPQIWDEEDIFDSYLEPSYVMLRDFYARAASHGDAVLALVT
jgi:Domain of unknown function (DUF1877)